MAILTFQAPVAGLRGKVGGLIYSANKSGPYIKPWGRGSNPRSLLQTAHRATLVRFSQAWRDLTSGERAGWDTYAALPAQDKTNTLGEVYSASGFNWFVEININRADGGQVQLDTAPVGARPGVSIINTFDFYETGAATDTFFNLDVTSPGHFGTHVIKAEVTNSIGRVALAEIRTYMINRVDVGTTRDFPFQDEAEAHFGTLQVGQKMFATIQRQDSEGQRGPAASASAEAQA